jgi:hypothetical protein
MNKKIEKLVKKFNDNHSMYEVEWIKTNHSIAIHIYYKTSSIKELIGVYFDGTIIFADHSLQPEDLIVIGKFLLKIKELENV